MKKILYGFFIFFFIVHNNTISQNLNKKIILNYNFGKTIHHVIKVNEKYEKLQNNQLILQEVAIGQNGMIYVADANLKKIIIFNKNGEFNSEINLEADNPNTSFNRIKLCASDSNSLYVLLLQGEFYSRMIKYMHGKILSKFKLEKPYPAGRNLKISYSVNKIYIKTFPAAIDPRYIEKGTVFTYNHQGQFLGRTDFNFEDTRGKIYKRISQYKIGIYETQKNILMTKELKKIDEIMLPYEQQYKILQHGRWYIIGLDADNNFYLSNNHRILKYNRYSKKKEEITFDVNTLKDKDVFIQNSSKIKVDYLGHLYMLGYESKLKDRSDTKAVILRIN